MDTNLVHQIKQSRKPLRWILVCTMATVPSVCLADAHPDLGVMDHASEYVRDYLSDSRRVGSLAGSIIGGALSAHPAGPVIGGLIGFFIGKSSMFEQQTTTLRDQSTAYIDPRRAILPPAGTEVGALSFSNGGTVDFAAKPITPSIPQEITSSLPPAITLSQPKPSALPATQSHVATPATPAEINSKAVATATNPEQYPNGALVNTQPPLPARALSPLPMGFKREQIAMLCSGRSTGAIDARLRNLCFYSQE